MSAVMVVVLTRASVLVEFMSVSRFVGSTGSFSSALGRWCLLERWLSERDLDIHDRWAKE